MAWQPKPDTKCPPTVAASDARGILAAQFDGPALLLHPDFDVLARFMAMSMLLRIIWADHFLPNEPIHQAIRKAPF